MHIYKISQIAKYLKFPVHSFNFKRKLQNVSRCYAVSFFVTFGGHRVA